MKLAEGVRNQSEVLDPTWRRWVDLVDMAVAESQQPAWSECVQVRQQRSSDAPLLHEATLRVNVGRATEFARQVADSLGIVALEAIDPLALILAGVKRDAGTIDVLADRLVPVQLDQAEEVRVDAAGARSSAPLPYLGHQVGTALAVSTDTVALLGQLCALPLLLNAARTLSPGASRTWQRGYCPVCGAWPSMVEMRGIQRERRMRCGCCGSDWLLPVLRCAFCEETDHRKLGVLLSEQGEQQIRVETCLTCRGYLKTLTTLTTLPFPTLALKDMSTVAFDLAARERAFARPTKPGWRLQVEIVQ